MPVSTSSQSSATYTTSTATATPSRFHLSQPISPPSMSSYAPTVTPAGQVLRMNVVSRIAIEGKAKQGQDGASVKMYMKVSIPVDSVTPGSTIALFPEENVKVLTSQIHPLDSNSVPYNFSSTGSPLLHNAARALNLPARLPVTFNSAFHLSSSPNIAASTTSTSRSSESDSVTIPPVDPQYTGQILVSGYHIAYVLPKHFPSRDHARSEADSDRSSHSLHHKRRLSISDRNHAHFMAAVDMWVPYVTRPPRFPYLLSIPTPRCLHNNIRLRIFPPSNTTSSFASLSSLEDDANSWDLTSDPHVTRTSSNRLARTSSYNHFADDESSDSSTAGFSDGFGIQGTFPSTDRIRVRWAKPMKSFDGGSGVGDPRRKVGVKDVKSEMTCRVRGRKVGREDGGVQGVVIDIEYKASCKGIWFPGVATLLGMDVGLVAKNSDVTWFEGHQPEWSVSGGIGYTGFNAAGRERLDTQPLSRSSSVDSPSPRIIISPSGSSQASLPNEKSRTGSSSSSSLLRAPLPSQNVAEYSFEGSSDPTISASSHIETLSSVSYLSQSNATCPPGAPLTLHLNINDILPPNKIPLTFTIKGTVLVTPRITLSRVNGIDPPSSYGEITEPINVPHFTVLAADAEITKIVVRNDVDQLNAVVEVYNPSGDLYKDPQVRKTVLQKGGSTQCGEDGGRIALKVVGSPHDNIHHGRAKAPTSSPKSRPPPSPTRLLNAIPQISDGPSLIPSVKAVVTPLVSRHRPAPDAYAVRIHLSVPVKNDTGWLEFGLARVGPSSSRTPLPDNGETCSPIVHIAGASVDGIPVQYAITNTERQPLNGEAFPGASFEAVGSTDWEIWAKIQVGPSSGDNVVIDYIVKFEPVKPTWFLSCNNRQQWRLLLPTFGLPVGRLEVSLESPAGFTCSIINSNLGHQHSNLDRQRLLHFAQGELFSPEVSLELRPVKSNKLTQWSWLTNLLFWYCTAITFLLVQRSCRHVLPTQGLPEGLIRTASSIVGDNQDPVTVTVTTTSTVANCPSSTRHLAEWTSPYSLNSAPSESMISTPSTSISLPAVSVVSLSPPPTDTIPPSPTTMPSQDSLSTYSITSLWEKLGFDGIGISLRSIGIPDLKFSSAKEKLAQFGGMVWGLVLGAYYYPEPRP